MIGRIDAITLSDDLKNKCYRQLVCKHKEESYVRERDVAVLNLFSFDNSLTSKDYFITYEDDATPLTFELTADIDDTVVTFGVNAEAFDVIRENSYISIGNENMVVLSVDSGAGTITVYARGHGNTDASAHTAVDDKVEVLGRADKYCVESGSCEIFVGRGKIQNGVQKHEYCAEWCNEDLCLETKGVEECFQEQVVADYTDSLIIKSRARALKQLNRMALRGTYNAWSDDPNDPAGTSAGLREFAIGMPVVGGAGTIGGIKFDASDIVDNPCYDGTDAGTIASTTALSYELLYKYFNKVDLIEGFHNVAVVSPKVKQALTDALLTCQTSCSTNRTPGEQNKFRQIEFIEAPWGNIDVVVDAFMKDDEIIFANTPNLKIRPYCYANGSVTKNKRGPITTLSEITKDITTAYFSFDASRNMCTELGIMTGFSLPNNC